MHKDNRRGASESLNTGRQSYTLFFCSVIHKEVAYELLGHLGVLISLFISGGRPMNGSLCTARGWGRAPPGAVPAPQNQLCPPGPCEPRLEQDRTQQQYEGGAERPLRSKTAKILRLQEMRA